MELHSMVGVCILDNVMRKLTTITIYFYKFISYYIVQACGAPFQLPVTQVQPHSATS